MQFFPCFLAASILTAAQLGSNQDSNPASRLLIGPIRGITTAWHDAPSRATIPEGSRVCFRLDLPGLGEEWKVEWSGAEPSKGDPLSASCNPGRGLSHGVSVRAVSSEATHEFTCLLETSKSLIEEYDTVLVSVSVDGWRLADDLPLEIVNAINNYALFRKESIADLHEVGEDHYVTSIGRTIELDANCNDSQVAPLLEWRLDGLSLGLKRTTVKFSTPGLHVLEIGPTNTTRAILVEAYSVSISESRNGNSVVLRAETTPPGYESFLQWLATSRGGFFFPMSGDGPVFATTFVDEGGEDDFGGKGGWIGCAHVGSQVQIGSNVNEFARKCVFTAVRTGNCQLMSTSCRPLIVNGSQFVGDDCTSVNSCTATLRMLKCRTGAGIPTGECCVYTMTVACTSSFEGLSGLPAGEQCP